MKKIKLALALISLSILLLPVMIFAQDPPRGAIGDMGDLVTKVENFVWIIFGGIATIAFVVAGILFLTAGGAPEKIATARSAFIWGIGGVVVGILAYSILAIVSTFLGG